MRVQPFDNRGDYYEPLPPHTPEHSPELGLDQSGYSPNIGGHTLQASDLLMSVSVSAEVNKVKIIELAIEAMKEFTKKATAKEPIWHHNGINEILNEAEYVKQFGSFSATLDEIVRMAEVGDPQWIPCLEHTFEFIHISEMSEYQLMQTRPFQTEATRESGYISGTPSELVEMLMNVEQWVTMFPNIISRAMVLGVLSEGREGSFDGALQVVKAEFHLPSPLVPTRTCYFARYCKLLDIGTWAAVDVSLEKLFPNPLLQCRRRPSGCLIQQLLNGCSKVTWIEHMEVNNRYVPDLFQPLYTSGFAFGARHWFGTLLQQCTRLVNSMTNNIFMYDNVHRKSSNFIILIFCHDIVYIEPEGKKSLLKLAERMMRTFCANINASNVNKWMTLGKSGAENVKITTKYSINEPGKPSGVTVVFATSLHLPVPPSKVFNFLSDEERRNEWDILSYGLKIEKIANITHDLQNRVSVLQVKPSPDKIRMLYLQESYVDETNSYVIYVPMDICAMSMVVCGGDPGDIAILPSGFSILPDRPVARGEQSPGTLLTIAFQLMDTSSTSGRIPINSQETIYTLIMGTVDLIKAAVLPKQTCHCQECTSQAYKVLLNSIRDGIEDNRHVAQGSKGAVMAVSLISTVNFQAKRKRM
ncbi:START domain [Dillenia turbinata]|uniref:START domain n=1 Tax=Dillenia turbinata TaxID=194707 RepID=A0AAN8VIS7_9MAGN